MILQLNLEESFKLKLLRLLKEMSEEERENPEEREEKEEKEEEIASLRKLLSKRRKKREQNRLPSNKKLKTKLLLSVKAEEEEVDKDNSDALF